MHDRRRFLEGVLGLGAATWAAQLSAGSAAAQTPPSPAAKPAPPAAAPALAAGTGAAAKKIGFALVGLGSLSEHQIAPALFEKTKLCKLTGLVSGHPDKAKAFVQKYCVPERNLYD